MNMNIIDLCIIDNKCLWIVINQVKFKLFLINNFFLLLALLLSYLYLLLGYLLGKLHLGLPGLDNLAWWFKKDLNQNQNLWKKCPLQVIGIRELQSWKWKEDHDCTITYQINIYTTFIGWKCARKGHLLWAKTNLPRFSLPF